MDQTERNSAIGYPSSQGSTFKVSPRKAQVEVDFGQQNNYEYKPQAPPQFK